MLNSIVDVIFSLFALSIFCRLCAEIMLKNNLTAANWYQRSINFLLFVSYYPAGYSLELLRPKFPRLTHLQLFGCYFDLTPALLIASVHGLRILVVFCGALLAKLFLLVFA